MIAAFAAVWCSITVVSDSRAYTPDDPTVVKMVDRGIKFLENTKGATPGETVLCAYTHFKVEHDESNPLVKSGIEEAKKFAAEASRGAGHKSHYECAVSVMLLCEVSPSRFRNELATFKRFYDEHQKPHGGFGYPEDQMGDVSQTQYAILAIWTLDRNGFKMDYNRVKGALDWLIAVQDINGPWPYHGKVPVTGGLARQAKTSMSMALAGAASLLIGGDALRVWGDTSADEDPGIVGLPKAVKIYKEDVNAERRKTVKIPPQRLLGPCEYMERWRQQNPETFGGNLYWYFYTAYTTERYESFLEIAKGLKADKSPAWYNNIVSELIKMQSAESGGWETRAHTSPALSTSFAILFLIRSTQKALGTGASATTIGGYQFGDDVSNAKLVGGKAVTKSPAQSVNQMLELLESDGADDLDGKALADRAVLPTDPVERSAQLDRLERLVRGSRSWQARRVSARLLGTSDDLRVVPALIYALSDPDHAVRAYARDGLRFISRKFEGFGMPDEPTNAEIRQAQRKWREWYLTMKPGYVFLDEI
ncbi:hypothetical protein Mal15_15270 [Stieleria maiorica]|uniref:Prenyltransferase and squalene oxidase repeat protein n=2 Tax=Stieleria maiorica TaxID=2795974 RepID=A0A5B9ME64_9BACT|nr:hypothetical protein Mal15_15270 [Stieleria maiorica]